MKTERPIQRKPTVEERKHAVLIAAETLRAEGLREKLVGMDSATLNNALQVALGAEPKAVRNQARKALAKIRNKGRDTDGDYRLQWSPTEKQNKEYLRLLAMDQRSETHSNAANEFLSECMAQARMQVCSILIKAGADPRADNQKSLELASKNAYGRKEEMLRFLIEHGARIERSGVLAEQRKNASRIYLRHDHKHWAMLVKLGADLRGADGLAALRAAVSQNDFRAAKACQSGQPITASLAVDILRDVVGQVRRSRSLRLYVKRSPADMTQDWRDNEREGWAFAAPYLAAPGIAQDAHWGRLVIAATKQRWGAMLTRLLSLSEQEPKQFALWTALRADAPEMLTVAIEAGADRSLRAGPTEAIEKPLAMFSTRKIKSDRPVNGVEAADSKNLFETGEVPLMSFDQALADPTFSHLGPRCRMMLLAQKEERELAAIMAPNGSKETLAGSPVSSVSSDDETLERSEAESKEKKQTIGADLAPAAANENAQSRVRATRRRL